MTADPCYRRVRRATPQGRREHGAHRHPRHGRRPGFSRFAGPQPRSHRRPRPLPAGRGPALALGTPMTIQPPDPGARSAGSLEPGSMFIEPQARTEPAAGPIRDAQPAAEVGVIIVPPPTPKPTPAPKAAPVAVAKAAPKSAPRPAARKSTPRAAHDDHDRRVAPRPERFLVRARVLRPPNGVWADTDPRSHRCRSQDLAVRDEDPVPQPGKRQDAAGAGRRSRPICRRSELGPDRRGLRRPRSLLYGRDAVEDGGLIS